jgi:hypothetical protein
LFENILIVLIDKSQCNLIYESNKAFPIGAPRTGNQAFYEEFCSQNIHCDRLIVEHDAVPKIPVVGYKHVGRKIKLHMSKDLGMLEKLNPSKIHHYSTYLKSIITTYNNLTKIT